MAGNLESGEQGKRKRGRPRKTAADMTGSESASKPARKRRTRLNSSEEQPTVVVPGTDDDDSGAALENLAAFVDTPEPPMFERRRRYQFVNYPRLKSWASSPNDREDRIDGKEGSCMGLDTCSKCGVHLQEFLTGRRMFKGELYCKMCYYEEMGNILEEHPLGGPILRPLIPEAKT